MLLFIYVLFIECLLCTKSLCMRMLGNIELALVPVHNHIIYMYIIIFNAHSNSMGK